MILREPTRLLGIKEVKNLVSLCRTTIWRLGKNGDFPQPVKIRNRCAWVSHEIETWIQARMEERQAKQDRK